MKQLSVFIEEFLQAEEVLYAVFPVDPDYPTCVSFAARFQAPDFVVNVHIHVDDEERTVRMAATAGIRVPSDRYEEMVKHIMGANHLLVLGHLSITPNGELEMIVTAAFNDIEPSALVLRRMLLTAIQQIGDSYPALMSMLSVGSAPRLRGGSSSLPPKAVVDEVVAQLLQSPPAADGESPEKPDTGMEPEKKPVRRRRRKAADE